MALRADGPHLVEIILLAAVPGGSMAVEAIGPPAGHMLFMHQFPVTALRRQGRRRAVAIQTFVRLDFVAARDLVQMAALARHAGFFEGLVGDGLLTGVIDR
jgi:hypothetical protein